ncbi:hypothetical protein [Actinomadura flavalba]|uniref:hypothetical protein n=1 Tax=Actinomadura flavalba TaxID=1120938 RepID=UPI000380C866|nr:hypothetical protein [Actinomadura flavalba]
MDGVHGLSGLAGLGGDPLAIYLNDHLASVVGGVELARRTAGALADGPYGAALERVAEQFADDRDALRDVMETLGLPVRHYKAWAAWMAEKAGRGKLNGRVLGRAPLSDVVELEGLRLIVTHKVAVWETLRALAARDTRLDGDRLDTLIVRAEQQARVLDDFRRTLALETFAPV